MAGPGKKRGLSPEDWAKVKAAYEAGESVLSLSKAYSIRRPTISARAKREAWTVHPKVHVDATTQKAVQAAAQSKVIDIATRRAVEAAVDSGVLEDLGDAIAAELLATKTAAKLAGEYMVDLLGKAKRGEIEPASSPGQQTVADVAKSVMSAYRTFQTTVRENEGIRPGTPSVPTGQEDGKPTVIEFVIVDGPEQAEAS